MDDRLRGSRLVAVAATSASSIHCSDRNTNEWIGFAWRPGDIYSGSNETGTLAITSDITLALTPNPASVELGATQPFQATVTSSGHSGRRVELYGSGSGAI